ncbi:uncharacterized protein LOC143278148 [Babylonia areolata]|uniref:uncharacterized protein LOC143278148 n=1 Tax=Babylonia areolata TaxID=304850 RepID=UPI003FD23C51
MAQFCRFVKLHDRFNAQVFTFMVPATVLHNCPTELSSKDFVYGQQSWSVKVASRERHLGAFLTLSSPSPGLACILDLSFTLVNAQHFTKNITFVEKNSEYGPDHKVHGRQTFAEPEDLLRRHFLHDRGELMLELEMRNIHNAYHFFMRLPKQPFHHHHHHHLGDASDRMESSYFLYGLSDWSLSLFPDASSTEADGSVAVQLQRHSSFDHLCCVRYRVLLGDSEEAFDSGDMEQILDASGISEPCTLGASVSRLARGRPSLRVSLRMRSAVYISETSVSVLSRCKNRAHLYDRDKQAWLLETDTGGKVVRFKLYYTDVSHVPRGFTRYVSWRLRLVTSSSSSSTTAVLGPYNKYYVQQDLDEGFVMNTDLPVTEVTDPHGIYLDPVDRKLTVYLEWQESHLMMTPHYCSRDDVTRLHKHQMTREIMALQAENYALEKQVYSYQQSMARKDARGQRP